ncbi:hypothetical protein U8U95_09865 [Enterococcus faecium]|uniref:DUF7006 family protein n=1 Tax=Enterococcus faecium TaxID=1352 RepID=UPI00397CD534
METNNFKTQYIDRFVVLKEQILQEQDFEIYNYVLELQKELINAIEKISKDTFWHVFPKILAVDSKISLLEKLFPLRKEFQLRGIHLINLIEKDYRTFNKENFGYNLTERCVSSIIFFVD